MLLGSAAGAAAGAGKRAAGNLGVPVRCAGGGGAAARAAPGARGASRAGQTSGAGVEVPRRLFRDVRGGCALALFRVGKCFRGLAQCFLIALRYCSIFFSIAVGFLQSKPLSTPASRKKATGGLKSGIGSQNNLTLFSPASLFSLRPASDRLEPEAP